MPHPTAGIRGVDPANDGDLVDHRQHLVFANLHRHRVCVSIGHEAAGAPVAGHPKTPRIVDDQQIRPPLFNELGRDASPSAGREERFASVERVLKAVADLLPRVGVSFSSPRVGHSSVGGALKAPPELTFPRHGSKAQLLAYRHSAPHSTHADLPAARSRREMSADSLPGVLVFFAPPQPSIKPPRPCPDKRPSPLPSRLPAIPNHAVRACWCSTPRVPWRANR